MFPRRPLCLPSLADFMLWRESMGPRGHAYPRLSTGNGVPSGKCVCRIGAPGEVARMHGSEHKNQTSISPAKCHCAVEFMDPVPDRGQAR